VYFVNQSLGAYRETTWAEYIADRQFALSPLQEHGITSQDSMNSVEAKIEGSEPRSSCAVLGPDASRGAEETLSLAAAVRSHWPEYLMEAGLLGAFMVSACVFGVLYEFPHSPVREAISSNFVRRMLMGASMGLTAIAIVYSPWGKQSGAHINPSVTFTFFRLGKVKSWDATFYIAAQFIGSATGVMVAGFLFMRQLADPAVRYVVTVPGRYGFLVAFAAEVVITFVLMSTILHVSNNARLARYTGICAGLLVATYISLEAPLSGMSMNAARSFGSGFSASIWTGFWIYLTAPLVGMLCAAEVYVRRKGVVKCCKLHHENNKRCIFCGANGGFLS
jgi:aquaporin Z